MEDIKINEFKIDNETLEKLVVSLEGDSVSTLQKEKRLLLTLNSSDLGTEYFNSRNLLSSIEVNGIDQGCRIDIYVPNTTLEEIANRKDVNFLKEVINKSEILDTSKC